ncbi:MAG: hypothetical protein HEQ23_01575 [Tepidisphaera sp.]
MESSSPEELARRPDLTRGAWLLAGVLAMAFAVNVGVIVLSVALRGTGPTCAQIGRSVLEIGLFLFVLIGHAWARWLTVALYGLASLIALGSVGLALVSSSPNIFAVVLMTAFAAVSGAVVLSLTVPGPITRYLASRRS